jgi:hypothetical protein
MFCGDMLNRVNCLSVCFLIEILFFGVFGVKRGTFRSKFKDMAISDNSTCTLKKAKRKFWNTQFVLPTLSKINQNQNKIDISILLQHKYEAE